MRDKDNNELEKGDLILLTIDRPVEFPAQQIIFKEQVERVVSHTIDNEEITELVCDIYYYPITDYGLEVAKYDAGQTQTNLHREEEFKVINVKSEHLIKGNSGTLRGYKKTLYDSIVALL